MRSENPQRNMLISTASIGLVLLNAIITDDFTQCNGAPETVKVLEESDDQDLSSSGSGAGMIDDDDKKFTRLNKHTARSKSGEGRSVLTGEMSSNLIYLCVGVMLTLSVYLVKYFVNRCGRRDSRVNQELQTLNHDMAMALAYTNPGLVVSASDMKTKPRDVITPVTSGHFAKNPYVSY